MNNYLENLDEKIKKYFKILSDEFPEFLYDYIHNNNKYERIYDISENAK